MKVLFVPRPDWKTSFGGDAVQMQATAARLRELNVEVDVARPEEAALESYDIIHLWTSLQMPHHLVPDVATLQAARTRAKIALSPVWAPQHVLRWMANARNWLFSQFSDLPSLTIAAAEAQLKQIAERTIAFTAGEGAQIRPFDAEPYAPHLRGALAQVDMLLPNSWMELQAIHHYIGVACDFHIVPNAVDAQAFLAPAEFSVPDELNGVDFAMMSARFDSRKQQDFVMLALKEVDIPLVFVGGVAETPIFERFRALGSTRKAPLYYFPHLDHAQLRAIYAAARVHLLPSLFESPGLSSIEAAVLDCSIVVGALAFEAEYFRSEAYYCDPCDVWSIGRAVERAFNNYERDAERREVLKQRIVDRYSWQRAAAETLAAYERVRTS